jgi:archaellum component FlaF (FlaF/FlaG flagellin family)
VSFTSFASNLVPRLTNNADNVFVRNLTTEKTINVSVSSSGAQGNGNSFTSAISGDGNVVAFSSEATNLVPGDTQPLTVTDVFVHTVSTGVTQRVSVSPTGEQANGASEGPDSSLRGGKFFGPSISADGTLVAFNSIASNLVPGDTNTCKDSGAGLDFTLYPGECPDIFVRNLVTGTTTRVSVDSNGAQSNDASSDPAISGDGSTVAFFTLASNLAPGDTNICSLPDVFFTDHPGQCPDIYVHSG